MKKILYLIIFWIITAAIFLPQFKCYAKAWERKFGDRVADLVEKVYEEANDDASSKVQKTRWNQISSRYCPELYLDSRYTLTRTLCSIREKSWAYMQYIIYIWITAAVIFLIVNGLKIVTSPDKEKQMWVFKKNIVYIIIWVVLLVAFNFILDVFVSLVALLTE
jgi:hypothetical protein